MKQTFKEFIKTSRARSGMTQRKFSEFINVSMYTVRAWEQGVRTDGVPMEGLIRDYISIKLDKMEI